MDSTIIEKFIAGLDDQIIISMHSDLVAAHQYDDLFDVSGIAHDMVKTRTAVAIRLSNPDETTVESLKTLEPSIRDQLKAIMKAAAEVRDQGVPSNGQVLSSTDQVNNQYTTNERQQTSTPDQSQSEERKEQLISELTELARQRDNRGQLQPEVQSKFGMVAEDLVTNYGLSFNQLEDKIGMTRHAISKYVKAYRKGHVDAGLELQKGESLASKGVKTTLEKDLSRRATEITNKFLNLGQALYDKYELEAAGKGYRLPVLADHAIGAFLKQGELYPMVIKLEKENDSLRAWIDELEEGIIFLRSENKKLKIVL